FATHPTPPGVFSLFLASFPRAQRLRAIIISSSSFQVAAGDFRAHLRPLLPLPPFSALATRHFLLPCRTLDVSNLRKDSSMTTPAHSVPASKLARSARSDEIVARHKKYLWPSVTNYFQQPLVADRGEMQYLWDLDGYKYLDFFGARVIGGFPFYDRVLLRFYRWGLLTGLAGLLVSFGAKGKLRWPARELSSLMVFLWFMAASSE